MKRKGREKAVVLLSGGVDSSTTLAIAKAEGYELYALSFDYRQRHRIELASARAVATFIGVEKHLVVGFDLTEIGGSALTADIEVPKEGSGTLSSAMNSSRTKRSPGSDSRIPVTYVPARNTIFLSFGLAWAEVLGAGAIFIGANAVDYSGYPDCRPEYLNAYEKMANLATKASVEGQLRFSIKAPLLSMTKSEIIRKGAELGLDYSLTWSCYDPQEEIHDSRLMIRGFRPCGLCDSCRFREKGFREAGISDPSQKK